jgi:hypothetical protein
MTMYGASGIQMRSMGRMGWGFGKVSRGAKESFLVILDLW